MGIKDSGDRTEFSTGAVRDMHMGKGRMDLIPTTALIELSKHCEAGALKYGERNVDRGIPQHSLIDSGMRHLVKYLRGDKDENHLVAALWNIAWATEQEYTKPELNDLPNRESVEKVDATAIRNKAIDDFVEKLKEAENYTCLPDGSVGTGVEMYEIEDIAAELKGDEVHG